MLDANPNIARYAWFALPPYQTLGLASSGGALTATGAAYKVQATPCERTHAHSSMMYEPVESC